MGYPRSTATVLETDDPAILVDFTAIDDHDYLVVGDGDSHGGITLHDPAGALAVCAIASGKLTMTTNATPTAYDAAAQDAPYFTVDQLIVNERATRLDSFLLEVEMSGAAFTAKAAGGNMFFGVRSRPASAAAPGVGVNHSANYLRIGEPTYVYELCSFWGSAFVLRASTALTIGDPIYHYRQDHNVLAGLVRPLAFSTFPTILLITIPQAQLPWYSKTLITDPGIAIFFGLESATAETVEIEAIRLWANIIGSDRGL